MLSEHKNQMFDDLSPSELISMGVQFGKECQYEDAMKIFDLCLALNPWDALVINNRADSLAGLCKYKEAFDEEMYALTIDPKLAIGWCTLAEIQAKFGERFSARLNLETALKLTSPTDKSYKMIEKSIQDLDEGKELTIIYVT